MATLIHASLLRDLNTSRTNWIIKVRVVRKYKVPTKNDANKFCSLEFLLIDEKGDRVQATVQPPNIAKYDAKVHERCLCYITDFDVTENNIKYGITNHKYHLTFMPNTEIFVVGDMNFPKTIYKFKTFREIHEIADFNIVGLFDFIDKVVKKYPLQNEKRTATGFISKHITVYLKDLEKQAIRCTLWDNLADEIIRHMDTAHGPLVIIIHLCKAKKWNERLELSSAFHATQLMADISIPEIQEFVSKLSLEDKSEDKVAFIQNSNSIVEDLSGGSCKVLSLNEILNTKQKGYYYVVAKLTSILSVGRWSYISCKRCHIKLSGSPDGYYCSGCELMKTHVVPRFRVKVKVVDGNTDSIFLLWDNVCEFVLGESAKEIRTRIAREIASEKKCSEKIESEYSIERAGRPEELQGLVGHTFIFKVNIKEQNISEENPEYVFSVYGISNDNDLIHKYKKTEINFTQKSEFLSWLAKNGEKIIEIDDSSDNEDHVPTQNSTKRALCANEMTTNSTYVSAIESTSKIYTHRYDKKIKKEGE